MGAAGWPCSIHLEQRDRRVRFTNPLYLVPTGPMWHNPASRSWGITALAVLKVRTVIPHKTVGLISYLKLENIVQDFAEQKREKCNEVWIFVLYNSSRCGISYLTVPYHMKSDIPSVAVNRNATCSGRTDHPDCKNQNSVCSCHTHDNNKRNLLLI